MEDTIITLQDHIEDLVEEREYARTIEACVDIDSAIKRMRQARESLAAALAHEAAALSQNLTALQYDGVVMGPYAQIAPSGLSAIEVT